MRAGLEGFNGWRDTAMTNDAQSQLDPIASHNWEPQFNALTVRIKEKRRDVTIGGALDGYAQSHQAEYVRKPIDFVQSSTANTSVAMNGSVKRNGAGMARAAENIARWKTYLPEECVRAMMNAGWHWST
jgi:hypothetical protein